MSGERFGLNGDPVRISECPVCHENDWTEAPVMFFVPEDKDVATPPLPGVRVNLFACKSCGFVALMLPPDARTIDVPRETPEE